MLTNFILGNLIKDLLNIIVTAVVLLLFLVIITFIVCSAVVILRSIILALVQTFKTKPKDDLAPEEEVKE